MNSGILAALSAINGQYNLSKDALEKIAGIAPSDLSDEDKVNAWVDSMKPMLSIMQRYADSRVTKEMKELRLLREELDRLRGVDGAAQESQEGTVQVAEDKRLGGRIDERMAALEQQLAALAQENKGLQERLSQSEQTERTRQFTAMKERVASELGMSGSLLQLVEGKLSADMDEAKVNEVLSDCKRQFVEMGLKPVESQHSTASAKEIATERAKAYLDRFQAREKTTEE